jgi:hypothetical protein
MPRVEEGSHGGGGGGGGSGGGGEFNLSGATHVSDDADDEEVQLARVLVQLGTSERRRKTAEERVSVRSLLSGDAGLGN